MAGYLLNNSNTTPNYSLGDLIEFIFKPDQDTLQLLGQTVTVDIVDYFNNQITTLEAVRLNDIFVAEYTIPTDIYKSYNISGGDETTLDPNVFILYDRWYIDINNYIDFPFTVNRKIEAVDEDNCVIEVFLDDLNDTENNKLQKTVFAFTTKLYPYYASVQDVRDTSRDILSNYDDFTIARQIINMSKVVDWHMAPSTIYYKQAFDHAVKNYVRIKSAIGLLLSDIQTNEEEKQIDTFRYKITTAMPKDLLDPLEEQAYKYSLFILAGGKDTPYVSKTFEKGIFDPNRPNATRAEFANIGFFPYLNANTGSTVIQIDGSNVEVRGERLVAYKYITNQYLSFDYGDVGYLARI